MTFHDDRPVGTDEIPTALKIYVEQSLQHLKDSISVEHGWNSATGQEGDCVHNRACGLITKDLADADAATTVISPGFTPTLIKFDWHYVVGANEGNHGTGYHDGTDDKCCATFASGVGNIQTQVSSATACLVLNSNSAGAYQTATCAFTTDTATLTWAKTSTPTGNAVIIWTAFG